MNISFSTNVRLVLSIAAAEAENAGAHYIGSEHLMLAMKKHRKNTTCRVLTGLGVDLEELEKKIGSTQQQAKTGKEDSYFSARSVRIIEIALCLVKNLNRTIVGTEHILFGILKENTGKAARILIEEYKITHSLLLKDLYGTDDLTLSNFGMAQQEADILLRQTWNTIHSSNTNHAINIRKIEEIVHHLDYVGELLASIERYDLIEKSEFLKEQVTRILENPVETGKNIHNTRSESTVNLNPPGTSNVQGDEKNGKAGTLPETDCEHRLQVSSLAGTSVGQAPDTRNLLNVAIDRDSIKMIVAQALVDIKREQPELFVDLFVKPDKEESA